MAEQDNIIIGAIVLGVLLQAIIAIFVVNIFSSYLMYFIVQISSIAFAGLFYLVITKIVDILKDNGYFERI